MDMSKIAPDKRPSRAPVLKELYDDWDYVQSLLDSLKRDTDNIQDVYGALIGLLRDGGDLARGIRSILLEAGYTDDDIDG